MAFILLIIIVFTGAALDLFADDFEMNKRNKMANNKTGTFCDDTKTF